MYLVSEKDYIAHHGIKGQKWGIRRYRNKDGSLTEAGKKRYQNLEREVEDAVRRTIKDTSPYKESFKDWQDMVDRYGYYKDKTNDEYKEAYEKAAEKDAALYESAQRNAAKFLKEHGSALMKNIDPDDLIPKYNHDDVDQFLYAFSDAYTRHIIYPALAEYRKEHPDRG